MRPKPTVEVSTMPFSGDSCRPSEKAGCTLNLSSDSSSTLASSWGLKSDSLGLCQGRLIYFLELVLHQENPGDGSSRNWQSGRFTPLLFFL